MKKIPAFLFLVLISCAAASQNSIKDSLTAKKLATELCECTNVPLSKIHPYILELLEVSVTKGEKSAEDTLAKRLENNPGELTAVLASSEMMESEAFGKSIDSCVLKIGEKYEGWELEGDKYDEAIVNALKQLPKCKIFYMLYILGTKDDD